MSNKQTKSNNKNLDNVYYYSDQLGKIFETTSIEDLILALFDGSYHLLNSNQLTDINLTQKDLAKTKKDISEYDIRLPLYDIKSNAIYLIYKENIYPRIFYDKYRFISEHFYLELKSEPNPSDQDKKVIDFLSNYDLPELEKTYLKIFYQSFVLNSYITSCRRPSFKSGLDHIEPYYSSRELYYLAYDWNLIKSKDKLNLSDDEMRSLCKKIINYDITSETLIAHQLYIYDSKAIGLVKHYSLFGSYFMNKYLRDYYCCFESDSIIPKRDHVPIKNHPLEIQIKLMIELIQNAPAFDKSHTVYRFVETDSFLKGIKPGDTYIDPSFMSTTRNPFYYQENYQFGYVLMKIKIPAGIKGIGLCIESYSNFPSEEEIILPPTSALLLESIIDSKETHTNVLNKEVLRKYEFVLKGNGYTGKTNEIILNMPDAVDPQMPIVVMKDLLDDQDVIYTSISDRLKFFTKNYVNVNFQFKTKIGSSKELTFIIESYDSSSVYKDFFYYHTQNGLLMYSFNPRFGNINIILEIDTEIHVNYYFKYSVTDSSHQLELDRPEWIEWLSMLSYVLGSRTVIIHGNYFLRQNSGDTPEQKIMKTRYTHSENIYQYLKNKKKWFDSFVEITPGFDYYLLDDYLTRSNLWDILHQSDRDELYQIAKNAGSKTIPELYIFITEHHPKLIGLLEDKISVLYQIEKNPFKNIYYRLDSWAYLYNNNFIKSMPSEKEFLIKKGSFKSLIGDKKIPQFKNRLRTYLVSSSSATK
jgi:hypothetical protein